MSLLVPSKALAYVNHGRLVAQCPMAPHCTNAMALEKGQTMYHCGGLGGCGTVVAIQWPDGMDAILAALEERRFKKYMNWYPAKHPEAEALDLPMDQTPDELREEARREFEAIHLTES